MIPTGVYMCTWQGMDRNNQTGEPVRGRTVYKFEGSGALNIITDPRSEIVLYDEENRYEVGKRYSFQFSNITPD